MARKNANGDGSRPRKRSDGRWEARYWVETQSGRKQRSVYCSSRKDCAENLAEAISAKENVTPIPASITVSEFLNQYLEVAKETLKKRTWEGHEETVRVHLVPSLGHLKLKELTRSHVQSLYTAKRVRGLSPGTVRRIHAVLSAALSSAVRWRLLPTTSARTPTHHGPNPQRFVRSTRKKREPSRLLPKGRGTMHSTA